MDEMAYGKGSEQSGQRAKARRGGRDGGKREEKGEEAQTCQFLGRNCEREVMRAQEEFQGGAVRRVDTQSNQECREQEEHFQKVMETEGRW